MKKIIYLIAVGIGLLTACKREAFVENTVYEKIAPADPKYSYFKVLNATAGSPVVNYYLDGVKSSGLYTTTGVESGYAYNALFPDLGYAVATPGTRNVGARLTSVATPASDRGLEVFTAPFDLGSGKYYTIFTTGIYNATSKKIESSLILQDIRPSLDTSKIFIRFVNMYNGSPNLDLTQVVSTTSQKLATNIPFGKASDWTAIASPSLSSVYSVTNNASGAVLGTSLATTLTKGRSYTVYIRGVFGNATYPGAISSYTTFY